jgi:hypothetical protein
LKGLGLQNRQGSSRRRAKCPSRQCLSGSRKCDGGGGEGILDGDGGEDAAGEILLRVGVQMCRRSVRVENETRSWSTVARARARRRPEIDGGGIPVILVDPRDEDGRICFYFFSLSVQHTGPFAVVVCRSERAPLCLPSVETKVGHIFFGCKRIQLLHVAASNRR